MSRVAPREQQIAGPPQSRFLDQEIDVREFTQRNVAVRLHGQHRTLDRERSNPRRLEQREQTKHLGA